MCCGNPVLNAGYEKETKELAEKNFKLFKERGVKKIVTNCPSCFYMFEKNYPKLVDNWNIEIEHITQTIYRAMQKEKISPTELIQLILDLLQLFDLLHFETTPRIAQVFHGVRLFLRV